MTSRGSSPLKMSGNSTTTPNNNISSSPSSQSPLNPRKNTSPSSTTTTTIQSSPNNTRSNNNNNNNSNSLNSSSSSTIINNNDDQQQQQQVADVSEDDLEAILQNYLTSETDVDLLSEKLGKQLSTLETEMVVGILDSGMGVNEVVSQLGDKDQTHLTGVTAWIDYYNKQLQDMKKYIEHIESKNNKMNIVSNNQKELVKTLEYLLNLLTLDDQTIKCLNNPDFASHDGLAAAIKAATDLRKALTTKLKSGMEHMVAVRDQRKLFDTYKLSFSRRVSILIEKEFKMTDHNSSSSSSSHLDEMPEHTVFFQSLNRYRPLVHWLKQLDIDKFYPLIPLYVKAYRSSYKHEIKPFFSNINHSILKESKDQNDYFSSHVKKALETNSKQQQQLLSSSSLSQSSSSSSSSSSSKSNQKKRSIDVAFQLCLSCLETSIMSEQKFLIEYFLFTDPPTTNKHHHHHHLNNNNNNKISPSNTNISPPPPPSAIPTTTNTIITGSGGGENGIIENALDMILGEMFDSVSGELKDMVEKADQINPFYLLTMLIDTETFIARHSVIGEQYSSHIVKILSEVQKTMKTLFNKFIDLQVDSIKSTQSSLKRCGVLSHFKHFPIFVRSLEKYRTVEIESISSLINSSYYKVVVSLNGWLDGLVDKLPPDDKYRFIARMENYYYLSSKMEDIGIACLKPYLENSRQRYRDNLTIYINHLINLKFKPLIDYFYKMDELLLTLPPTDIQFQQSHSKQQFKKIVEKFKTENIEKGFSKALSSIHKHISKESVLILLIWEHLEEIFIDRYNHFQDLTQKCYQQSMPVSSDQVKGLFALVFTKDKK